MSTRPFDSLTPRGKVVRIAKDVLLQIELGRIIPTSGEYCGIIEDNDDDIYLSKILVNAKKCEACARGSMVIAMAGLSKSFSRFTETDASKMSPFDGLLSNKEVWCFENWFEKACGSERWKRMSDTSRLIAIMNNLIANRGVFSSEGMISKYGMLSDHRRDLRVGFTYKHNWSGNALTITQLNREIVLGLYNLPENYK